MLPGKKYTPEDILRILRKRFWIIVLPWAVVAAATAAVARKLPDLYRSTATIQIIKPQVPESVVRSLTSTSFQDRLNVAQQNILSRTRLEELIREFDLYKEERASGMVMEVVADRMRRNDIRVNPQRGDAFTISYSGREPLVVQRVTERLASQFRDESIKEGGRKAEGTNAFVEGLVEEKRKQLEATEAKVRDYRTRYATELPEQSLNNIQTAQGYQNRLSNLEQMMNQDNTAKLVLESQIEATEKTTDPVALAGQTAMASAGPAAQRLAKLEAELKHMETVRQLMPGHHEMRAKLAEIAEAKKDAAAEAARTPAGTTTGPVVSPAEQTRANMLLRLRGELKIITDRIASNRAEQKRIEQNQAALTERMNRGPAHAAELLRLTREYETQSELFKKLLATRESSSLSVNLENRQLGEQFNLIDPARIPQSPYSPDRFMINLFGLLGGLAVGLGIVLLLEYRDSTFRADYELAGLLNLPVLAVVPLMRSAAERRAEFRKKLLVNLGLGSAVAACGAVLAYSFLFLR